MTAALSPVLGEVAGLPGAPVRVTQVAGVYSSNEGEAGAADDDQRPAAGAPHAARLTQPAWRVRRDHRRSSLSSCSCCPCTRSSAPAPVRARPRSRQFRRPCCRAPACRSAAQPKVLSILGLPSWARADVPPSNTGHRPGPAAGPVYAAARRLAALPPAARHAWLAAHLAALRSGQLTLGQLP